MATNSNEKAEVKETEVKDEKDVKTETKDECEAKETKETTLDDKVKELETKNAELEEQVSVLKNEYAKAYADTENMRKRLQKEHDSFTKYHIQSFAKDVLPVLDNCERALSTPTKDEAMHKGVEMIYTQLKVALEKEGVTEIEALNQPFDGNWHQALMTETKEGVEPGIVTEVLQKGYKLKDRIIRAAMVKVSE